MLSLRVQTELADDELPLSSLMFGTQISWKRRQSITCRLRVVYVSFTCRLRV